MARLIFDLRDVPDDESVDVRALLEEAGIAFYETSPSVLGIFAGGLWVADETIAAAAKSLIAEYQQARSVRVRAEVAAAVRDGSAPSAWQSIRREPVKVLVLLLAAGLIAAITVLPFILFGNLAGVG
jgi:hypothetical protein